MRCKYCGSNMIHPETRHKTFSTGKAVAGAVTFGVVGAAAGMIGKDIKGYQCGQCGAFMENAMDFSTELSINSAIRDAESGRDRAMYDYFKSQYGNIQANITGQSSSVSAPVAVPVQANMHLLGYAEEEQVTVKQSYRNLFWNPDCPTYVDTVTVLSGSGNDKLKLLIFNQCKKHIRSAYYEVKVFDDTFDLIDTIKCVYQGIDIEPGQALPLDKEFDLKTDLAYKVEISCEKVAFTDDEVWRGGEGTTYVLTEQVELTKDNFPRLQYVRKELAQYSKADPDGKIYIPVKAEGFWQCICKHPSLAGEICVHCGAEYDKLETLLSQTRLLEVQKKAVMERAEKRAALTVVAYENARKEIYALAQSKYDEHTVVSVKEAIKLFEKLGDYEDAAAKAEQLRAEIPALELKIEEEKAARAEQMREERLAQEEAEKEKQSQDKKKKVAPLLVVVISYVIGMIWSLLNIYNIIATSMYSIGLPGSVVNVVIQLVSAILVAISFNLAIRLYAKVIGKMEIDKPKLKKATTARLIISIVYAVYLAAFGIPPKVIPFAGVGFDALIAFCYFKEKKAKKQ